MPRFVSSALLSVLAIGIRIQPLAAQLGTATISGVVSDTTGATIAGAAITAIHVETGFRRQTLTNPIGQYNLPSLTPGQYDLRIESVGFKKAEQKGLILQVDQNARIDVNLEVGQLTESIEIVGQAPLVDSQTATLGAVIDT